MALSLKNIGSPASKIYRMLMSKAPVRATLEITHAYLGAQYIFWALRASFFIFYNERKRKKVDMIRATS